MPATSSRPGASPATGVRPCAAVPRRRRPWKTRLRCGAHRYDFPAISAQPVCLTVTADFSQCGGNPTQIVAYRNYNPATPNTGHLADSGYSISANIAFSTRLAGSQAFSIVVNEVDAGQGCGSYAFRLEADTCQPPPAGDQIFYSGFQLVIPVG